MFKWCLKFVLYLGLAFNVSPVRAGAYEDFFKSVVNDDAANVQALLARGFDPNSRDEKGQTLLYLAQRDGAVQVARVLLDNPQLRIDQTNSVNETALMVAALRDRERGVAQLLDKGAAINGPHPPGAAGWTPLHYAAAAPGSKALLLLLARGARVDARSPNGTTPLMMAAQYGPEDAVEALLKQGADARQRNDQGLTAADFARRGGREALAARLSASVR